MNQFEAALDDGDTRTVKRLLREYPALLEEPDKYGRQPLMQAVSGMDRTLSCVQALLDAGAEVNAATREGCTALHHAVDFMGKLGPATEPGQFVRLLVAAGADVEARQHWGWTPLMRAVLEGSVEETQALLAVGANPNVVFPQITLPAFIRGRTLLMCAAPNQPKLKLLLSAGADVEARDEHGQTALEYAQGLLTEATREEYAAEVTECIQLLTVFSRRTP